MCVLIVLMFRAVSLLSLVADAVDDPAEFADEIINAKASGSWRDEIAGFSYGDAQPCVELCSKGRARLCPCLSLMVVLGELIAEEGCLGCALMTSICLSVKVFILVVVGLVIEGKHLILKRDCG